MPASFPALLVMGDPRLVPRAWASCSSVPTGRPIMLSMVFGLTPEPSPDHIQPS
jgi:hypothetical protein